MNKKEQDIINNIVIPMGKLAYITNLDKNKDIALDKKIESNVMNTLNKYIIPIPKQNKISFTYQYQMQLKDFIVLGEELGILKGNVLLYLNEMIRYNNKIKNKIENFIEQLNIMISIEFGTSTEEIQNNCNKLQNSLQDITTDILGDNSVPFDNRDIYSNIMGIMNIKEIKQRDDTELFSLCLDFANENNEIQTSLSPKINKLLNISIGIINKLYSHYDVTIFSKYYIFYNNEYLYFNGKQNLINCMQDIQEEIGITAPQEETTSRPQQEENNNFILVTSINTLTPIQQSKFATDETIRQYFIGTVKAWENLFNSKCIKPATEENGLQITCIQKNYIHTLLNYLMEKQVFKKIQQGINYYKQLEDLNIFYYNNKKITNIRKQAQPKNYKEIETVIKDIIKL